MEYIPGVPLEYFIEEEGDITEVMAKTISYQMILALDSLKRRSTLHRDIKPVNILISSEPLIEGQVSIEDNSYPSEFNLKISLIDFGLAVSN